MPEDPALNKGQMGASPERVKKKALKKILGNEQYGGGGWVRATPCTKFKGNESFTVQNSLGRKQTTRVSPVYGHKSEPRPAKTKSNAAACAGKDKKRRRGTGGSRGGSFQEVKYIRP